MSGELQSVERKAGWLHPGYLLMLLFFIAPLPFSMRFLSYDHPKQFVIISLIGLAFMACAPLRLRPPAFTYSALWALLFFGLGFASTRQFGPAIVLLPNVMAATIFLLQPAALAALRQWRVRLDASFVVGAWVVSLLALGQYAGVLNYLFPPLPHYDQRMYSVFGNQDLLGGYMAAAIAVLWVRGPRWRQGRWTFLLGLVQLPLISALMLSGCRSAWVAAAVGVLVATRVNPKARHAHARLALTALVMAAIAGLLAWESTGARLLSLIGGQDIGSGVRFWIWDGAFRLFLDNPLIGTNPGQFAKHIPQYMGEALHAPGGERYPCNDLLTLHAHSEPLNLIAEGGILFSLPIIISFLLALRHAKPAAAWAPLLAMCAFAMVNDAFHSAPHAIASLWWLACVLRDRKQQVENWQPQTFWRSLDANLAGGVCLVVLSALHIWFVLYPSNLLVRAEDRGLAGEDPTALYMQCTQHPLVRAEAHLGLAAWHVHQEEWKAALESAQLAAFELDHPPVHWLMGLAAHRLGDHVAARDALKECLFRNPRNQPAFNLLWRITPAAERDALRAHAARWGLGLPD